MLHRLRLFYSRIRARGIAASVSAYSHYLQRQLLNTTPRKMWNWLACKAGRGFGISRAVGLPYRYYIDPINICVLRCPLCPTGTGKMRRPRGRMRMDDFRRIVDEIAHVAYVIYLYNWGESFLHPDIIDMIEYAAAKRVFVRISANLNALTADMAPKIVHSGLSQLVVSIDGASQESYETYRVGGNLAKVRANIRAILDARHAAKAVYPRIGVRMLVSRHNEKEIDSVRRLVESLGVDTFSIGPLFIDPKRAEDAEEWLPEDARYRAYESRMEPVNTWDCADLWESCAISWDGGVLPCCWLHDPKDDFGNVLQQPLAQIWNNALYRSSRQALRWYSRCTDGVATVCTKCRGNPDYEY